jgi:hypothetical protein
MTSVFLVFGLIAALAFAAGYGTRAFVSHRRRARAKQSRQWRLPAE